MGRKMTGERHIYTGFIILVNDNRIGVYIDRLSHTHSRCVTYPCISFCPCIYASLHISYGRMVFKSHFWILEHTKWTLLRQLTCQRPTRNIIPRVTGLLGQRNHMWCLCALWACPLVAATQLLLSTTSVYVKSEELEQKIFTKVDIPMAQNL